MYLEEVIIDGFKSYANRTVIGPFHSQFNAISGLNGTGKSNILDAVCFVMGIKSLSQMRVSRLDELIYKQGQAGVTKASVTLIFRNNDRQSSPIGMADLPKITISRQIAIGGRERFVMNGHNARMSDIQTVFQSVQLNVNHPHFLVMQGRITKVINMKPPEILGMIEESAGTRLYETKRSESAKKIAMKETKLQEINSIVHNEIEPALEKLRKEQEEFATSLRIAEDITRREKFCRAFEYFQLTEEIKSLEQAQEQETEESRALEEQITFEKSELNSCNEELGKEERKAGGVHRPRLLELAQKRRELENELAVRSVAVEEAKRDEVELKSEIKKMKSTISATRKQLQQLKDTNKNDFQKETEHQEELKRAQAKADDVKALIEELRTGHVSRPLASQGNTDPGAASRQTLREKLIDAEVQLRRTEAEVQQLEMTVAKWENDICKLEAEEVLEKQTKGEERLALHIKQLEDKINKLKHKVNGRETLLARRGELEKRKQELESQYATVEDCLLLLERKVFQVTRVHQENPNCATEGIEGVAAELFRVKKDNQKYCLALEEAGKARLLNIVVKDDEVAKRLLEKYKSLRRITCIPLNKIRSKPITDERLAAAKIAVQLPSDSADLVRPLDVAEPVSSKYVPALTFVFGQAFLCSNPSIAQTVCRQLEQQHSDIKGLAITIDGDHYNPAGSVSGGSQSGLGDLLANLEQLHTAKDEKIRLMEQLKSITEELQTLSETSMATEVAARELGALDVALQSSKVRLEEFQRNSNVGKLVELREKRQAAAKKLEELKHMKLHELEQVIIPALHKELKNSGVTRLDRIQQLELELNELGPQIADAERKFKQSDQGNRSARQEIAVLENQLAELVSQVEEKENQELPNCQKAIKEAEATRSELVAAIAVIVKDVEELNVLLEEKSRENVEISKKKGNLESSIAATQARLAKIHHAVRNRKKLLIELGKRRTGLMRDHDWIRVEQRQFNRPNGPYDFQKSDATLCFEQLEVLKRESQKMEKKINKNVATVLEACEKELQELKEKKAQLTRDKKKLEEFIDELDIKKRSALEACWRQVDEYFSCIFSTLLTSSDAHLCLTKSGKLEDGMEMQVTLSGIKKSSLGELSGGQRSLLALSLILGLLKYKMKDKKSVASQTLYNRLTSFAARDEALTPAPLYILDEIDAALDLSHTQRIGEMIRTQFSRSQFIVVSLKENLFNYADVLFRTSFLNGTSCVTRQCNSSSFEQNDEKRKRSLQVAGTKSRTRAL